MAGKLEKLARLKVPALDKILGKPFKVLDDGFIRVVDYLGTDQSIVQAARVSYGAGTKTQRDDRTLIRYLLRHDHTSPFEMCELKLHVRVPMDCWRQWIRHRTANVNEYSTRYSIAIDSFYGTEDDAWRGQDTKNRQGSADFLPQKAGKELSAREKKLHNMLLAEYKQRIDSGVAREQARKDLPLSTYTEAYWKIDLQNLLRFLRLRMDIKAQYEIRKYSETINDKIVKVWCPMVWEAFNDYQLNSLKLSGAEQQIISAIVNQPGKALNLAKKLELITDKDGGIKRTLECLEMEDKLKKLNISVPWL